jgi:hypothetical protein
MPKPIAQLVKRIPKAIRIGPHDVAIEWMTKRESDAEDKWGYWARGEMKIGLVSEWPNASKFADTLLHEIEHALWTFAALTGEDGEERIVSVVSAGRVQVFRDNPWLLGWLKDALS